MLVQEWDMDMAIAVAKKESWEDGMEKGEKKRAMEIARKMRERGKNVEEVAEMTGLTVDDVLRL